MSCVEEDMQGVVTAADEWKCLYSSKSDVLQACNAFACPGWRAQEWSPVGAFVHVRRNLRLVVPGP